MNLLTNCLVAVVFFNSGTKLPGGDGGQDKTVLDHYRGQWSSEFTINPQAGGDRQVCSGNVTGEWVVGGQFLEQTGRYRLEESTEELVIKTLMSFDKKNLRYQFDYFISNGEVRRSHGIWNSADQTMTSSMLDEKDGKTTTIVADFSKSGVERWTIETRDRHGNVLMRIEGTNSRKQR